MMVELDSNTGVAVIQMKKPPVNSLNLEFLTEFAINMEKLEMDRECRGVVLTSSIPKIFSAGLDINEMYGKTPEHTGEFWRAVQEIWLKLYGSNLVTIAAINVSRICSILLLPVHFTSFEQSIQKIECLPQIICPATSEPGASPAGGCLLAMACDYRIMADNPKYAIGLNETKLGIVAPFWFKDTMINVIGRRATEHSLQLGLMYSTSEALKIGLVDQLVAQDKIMTTALSVMSEWLAIPDHARQITKSMMRKPTLDQLLTNRESDIQNFVNFISKDSIQKSLQLYLEMLRQRKG
ncbi:enoyl-CoA delta isomerase 1, mitochondrial isoform X3 [Carcharodon carcharias]|nr:enoyl-CoA delta isomerase 1, mitochondrial isoform X3 [Carcharodon carcharias]XP_041062749.1 enoyl-CoA delta isomerase 1, mitochondrial isoform X3 [Carcharodon carcharias]